MIMQPDLVTMVQRLGYARSLEQAEVDAYNEAVEAYIEAAGEDGEPGASPIAGEPEDAPEGSPEGEGEPSGNEPPPGSEEIPLDAPVATTGTDVDPASSQASEAGATIDQTPTDDASSKKKKG